MIRAAVLLFGALLPASACLSDSGPAAGDRLGEAEHDLSDPCRPTFRETIFGECAPTTGAASSDPGAVTLGVRFTPSVPGEIRGIRFYRSTAGFPAGGYTTSLWTAGGTRLATGQATISQNPSSGWLSAPLNTSVRVQAGQTYVASYFAPAGQYELEVNGLAAAVQAPKLTALASGGVYTYGAAEQFPTSTYQSSNYFVDVIFIPDSCPQPPAETLFGGCPPASTPDLTDTASVTLGVRFTPNRAGTINAVRFYRSQTFPAAGFDIGLWDAQGTLIAEGRATIGQNPSTGWFTGVFNTVVPPLQAGQTYVAGYRAPAGAYEQQLGGYASPINSASLTATAGLYTYGPSLAFPTSTYQDTNYFVDVQFFPTP